MSEHTSSGLGPLFAPSRDLKVAISLSCIARGTRVGSFARRQLDSGWSRRVALLTSNQRRRWLDEYGVAADVIWYLERSPIICIQVPYRASIVHGCWYCIRQTHRFVRRCLTREITLGSRRADITESPHA
jgi:hypothetical protein